MAMTNNSNVEDPISTSIQTLTATLVEEELPTRARIVIVMGMSRDMKADIRDQMGMSFRIIVTEVKGMQARVHLI